MQDGEKKHECDQICFLSDKSQYLNLTLTEYSSQTKYQKSKTTLRQRYLTIFLGLERKEQAGRVAFFLLPTTLFSNEKSPGPFLFRHLSQNCDFLRLFFEFSFLWENVPDDGERSCEDME